MKEKIQINSEALSLRRSFGEDNTSPVDIFSLIASQTDLTVVYYPMRDTISGMCVRDDTVKLIAINSKLTQGRQRFTAAHELCHLFFHNDFKTIICSREITSSDNECEREANQFASYFLAPYDAFRNFINEELGKSDKPISINDVVRIEQYFGLSRQATLVRLLSENLISEHDSESMKSNVIASALRLGYSTDLYLGNPVDKQYMTVGSYIKMAYDLFESERISAGKYEELLLDAFRDDIVYGTSPSEGLYD